MNAPKTPSFFRPSTPSSFPSSQAQSPVPTRPESSLGIGAFRPTKLSLSSFMRQASLPTLEPAPAPVPQDASYLEMLGLKLSGAATKALAQPIGPPTANDLVSGKRPIPPGRGLALGSVIAAELNAVHDNSHLYRTVLRSLQKPLTVLLTNLSNWLLPLVAAQAFLCVPTISNQFLFPNPVQAHALAVAKFCEELLQVFDEMTLGLDVDSRGDGLKPVRDGLGSLIKRVINPLIGAIRAELIPLVEALETPNTTPPFKSVPGNKTHVVYHPSIVALQTLMPSYDKVLKTCTTSTASQASLASLLISVLWKALVALSHRNDIKPSATMTPESPPMKKRQGSTPPVTPPPARFSIKLPPSRPPSPPAASIHATPAQDCRALYDLLFGLPRPCDGQAREAVDEAFEGLRTLPDLLRAIKARPENMEISNFPDVAKQLSKLTADIPFLIGLPVILYAFGDSGTSSVAKVLGISGEDYRKGCLSGFSRAEECAETIGQRVLEVFRVIPTSSEIVVYWLELELEGIIDA